MYTFVKTLPRRWKRRILLGIDIVLVPVALYATFALQAISPWPSDITIGGWVLYPLLIGLTGLFSTALGLPDIKLVAYETRAILRTGMLALLLALFGAVVNGVGQLGATGADFVSFAFLFFGLSVASRVIGLRLLLWIYSRAERRTRVLIYGAGATGVQLATAIGQSEEIEPVAFVDDNKTLQGIQVAGLRVYSPARISELILSRDIDRVVLAMPSLPLPQQAQIARRLEKIGCDVHRLPSLSELVGNRSLVDNIEPVKPTDFLGRVRLDTALPGTTETYAGKSVLVSGAGGSIGAELCRQLLANRPSRLILLDQSEPALFAIEQELRTLVDGTGVEIVPVLGSVADRALVERCLAAHRVEIVLHAAAHKHVPMVEANEIEGLRNNVLGTQVLAEQAGMAGVERFVLVSSDKAVRPSNVMGASKRLAEMVVQDLAARSPEALFSMVRFGNVLGSSGSVIPLFMEQIARGGPVTLTDPGVTRYFMTLSEAARLVLLAGTFAEGGDVFVLDMGEPMPIRKLARQLIERSGYTVRDKTNPDGDIEIKVVGLRPGEKLVEELLIGPGLRATPHPKILRAQEAHLSEIEIATMLRDLRGIVEDGDAGAARDLIACWVEGYRPPEPDQRAGQGG